MTQKNHLELVGLHLSDSLAAEPSQPDPFYVATNGSDRNNGSLAHPWATVQHAVDVVPNGSTIYLQSGGQLYFAYDVHDVIVTDNLIYGISGDVLIGNPFCAELEQSSQSQRLLLPRRP